MAQPRGRAAWRGDLLVIAAVLAMALGGFAWRAMRPTGGQTARLTTPDGVRALPLSQDTTLSLTGAGGLAVTVEVRGGAARFAASGCPDQVCVNTGWLSRPGDTAACVPAGMVLRIDGEAEVDAVAG